MSSVIYDRIIVQQLDPDTPAAGGIDSCLRDLIAHAPEDLRILVLGVSRTEPLWKVRKKTFGAREVDFLAVAHLDPMSKRRFIPHSLRVVFGAVVPLLCFSSRKTTIETHRFEAGFLASLVRCEKRVVYAHTDPVAVVGGTSDSFWRKMPKLYSYMESRVLRKASRTIVFSRKGAEYYSSRFSNITCASTWYNDDLFKVATGSRSERALLWVGRFEAPKDPLYALEVIESINRRRENDWKLIMIGDGSLRAQLETEILRRSLGDSVSLAGVKTREEVAKELAISTALLMTSNFEGSPVVLYESMAVGTPVIAPEQADPDQVIRDGVSGYRVPRKAEALAEAVLDLPVAEATVIAATVADRAMEIAVQEVWNIAR